MKYLIIMTHPDSSPLTLLHSQLALERKGVDPSGRLFRLPGDNPDEMGRVLAARLSDGTYIAYMRHDVPEAVADSVHALTPKRLYHEHERVLRILESPESVWRGRTYFFSACPRSEEYPLVVERADKFVVDVDGVMASEAWSSRSTDFAAELAVETRPDFRQRGYGRQVCAAWASQNITAGRIAFYSHDVRNTASEALALSLGVVHIFDVASYA